MVPTHGNLDYSFKSAHFIVEDHINTTATHPETGHRHNPLYNSPKIVPCATRSGIVVHFTRTGIRQNCVATGNPSGFVECVQCTACFTARYSTAVLKSIRKSMMILSYATSGNTRVEDLDLAWMLKRPGCLVLTYIAPKGILHHMFERCFRTL